MKDDYYVYYLNAELDIVNAGMHRNILDALDAANKLFTKHKMAFIMGWPSLEIIRYQHRPKTEEQP